MEKVKEREALKEVEKGVSGRKMRGQWRKLRNGLGEVNAKKKDEEDSTMASSG